jgi:hypothetical protein
MGESPVASSSKRPPLDQNTPTKRIKLRQTSGSLHFPGESRDDQRNVFKSLVTGSEEVPKPIPSKSRNTYSPARLPMPIKSEDDGSLPLKQFPLGVIARAQTPLLGTDRVALGIEAKSPSEDPLYDSEDEADRKPCHPRMSE